MYLNDWTEGGEGSMLDDFGVSKDVLADAEVLLASYTYEDYSGQAFVLFKKNNRLYEVNGSHCSCHGLSEESYSGGSSQWEPEETTVEALEKRLEVGYYFEGCKKELKEVLESIKISENT